MQSRNEPCVFTLKPVTHTIGDFLEMLRMEDAGIDRAVVRNTEGVRISSTTSIQTLLQTLSFDLGRLIVHLKDVSHIVGLALLQLKN